MYVRIVFRCGCMRTSEIAGLHKRIYAGSCACKPFRRSPAEQHEIKAWMRSAKKMSRWPACFETMAYRISKMAATGSSAQFVCGVLVTSSWGKTAEKDRRHMNTMPARVGQQAFCATREASRGRVGTRTAAEASPRPHGGFRSRLRPWLDLTIAGFAGKRESISSISSSCPRFAYRANSAST